MSNPKPLVIITANAHDILITTLKEKGYEVLYEPLITYENLSAIVKSAQGLIVTTRIINVK